MRRLIVWLIFLIASVWVGLLVMKHPGYVMVTLAPWMIEMPLWFAALACGLVLVVFYWLVTSIDQLQFLWFRLRNWLRIRRERQSYSKTQHGLMLLIEGRWKKAEQLLLAGMQQSHDPLMNYLGCVKAADAQGCIERRDQYIRKAYQVAPTAGLAIGILQAELALERQQNAEAISLLDRLHEQAPKQQRVNQLREMAYIQCKNWGDLATVHLVWQKLPRASQKNPAVVFAYVAQLVRCQQLREAKILISKTVKKTWHAGLVDLYGTLPSSHPTRQLAVAGEWLKQYGPNATILLTLGRICVRAQLWGKAKEYFDQCLAFGPCYPATVAYGRLLEELEAPKEALAVYRAGALAI